MYFFSSACVALLAIRLTRAGLSPSEPSPGTVWTPGQEGTIQWSEDDSAPSIDNEWSHFTIDFMTGDNNKQVKISTVAEGVDARNVHSFKWKVPSVDIPAAIYFFMFTSNSGKHFEWTTRFTITSSNGSTVEAPHKDSAEFENKLRTDGTEPIPWGIGKILNDTADITAASAKNSSSDADLGAHYSSILAQSQTTGTAQPSDVLNEVLKDPKMKTSMASLQAMNWGLVITTAGFITMYLSL